MSSTVLKAQHALIMIRAFDIDTVTSVLQALLTHLFPKQKQKQKPCETDTVFPNLQMRKLKHVNVPEYKSIHRTSKWWN